MQILLRYLHYCYSLDCLDVIHRTVFQVRTGMGIMHFLNEKIDYDPRFLDKSYFLQRALPPLKVCLRNFDVSFINIIV